jgi:hypothetical protein
VHLVGVIRNSVTVITAPILIQLNINVIGITLYNFPCPEIATITNVLIPV